MPRPSLTEKDWEQVAKNIQHMKNDTGILVSAMTDRGPGMWSREWMFRLWATDLYHLLERLDELTKG